jgi:hypothetical protein
MIIICLLIGWGLTKLSEERRDQRRIKQTNEARARRVTSAPEDRKKGLVCFDLFAPVINRAHEQLTISQHQSESEGHRIFINDKVGKDIIELCFLEGKLWRFERRGSKVMPFEQIDIPEDQTKAVQYAHSIVEFFRSIYLEKAAISA